MKRNLKIILFFIAVMAIILSACQEPDISKEDPTPPQPKEYILPVFTKSYENGKSRGLMEMPIWDEAGRSNGVMQALPAMIGYESIKKNNFDEVKEEKGNQDIEILGFLLTPDTKAWVENDDGYLLKYDLVSNGRKVGFLQYYYSFEKKMFSYRQMVLVTLVDLQTNILLSLEFNDIPVQNQNQLRRFTFGQLNADGSTEENAFADRIDINNKKDGTVELVRTYMSGVSNKENFVSIFRPDMTYGSGYFPNEHIINTVNRLDEKGNNKNGVIDTEDEAKAAGLGFVYNIITQFYENADEIRNADGGHTPFKPYKSYEDFRNASLEDTVIQLNRRSKEYDNMSINPVCYSWKNGMSRTAAATFSREEGQGFTQGTYLDVTAETWSRTGFDDFYHINTSNSDELRREFINEHLKACGLDDKNFIENFTYAALDDAYGRSTYWPCLVTTDEPDGFKKHFDNLINQ